MSDFNYQHPNRVRSVLHVYCLQNSLVFHQTGEAAYELWLTALCKIEASNTQLAARLARALDQWRKFDAPYRKVMHQYLQRAHDVLKTPEVLEIINAALGE